MSKVPNTTFYCRVKTPLDSMAYLPLYRIKGGIMKCSNCHLKLDFRIGQFCLFYILENDDKVGIIFEYSALSKSQAGVSWNPAKLPTFKYVSQNMTIGLLIKFMTIDHVQSIKVANPNLEIKAEKSVKRNVLNWYRKQRGQHVQDSELLESSLLNKWLNELDLNSTKGDGIYCVNCMKGKHPEHHRNARHQFKGYAQFDDDT